MYSKCGVSPRIRQPRQTTASNRPLSAACCADSGISNAPGTRTMVMSSRATPAASSALTAAAFSFSVTKGLNLETTMATRRPVPRPDPSMVTRLTPLELGLPLREKRRRAFAHVVGRRHQAEERRFVLTRLGERHLESLVHGVDDLAERDRRAPRQLARPGARLRHQLGRRHDAIDETDPLRLVRGDRRAGENHLHRLAFADEAGQPLRTGVSRDEPQGDLRLTEP